MFCSTLILSISVTLLQSCYYSFVVPFNLGQREIVPPMGKDGFSP